MELVNDVEHYNLKHTFISDKTCKRLPDLTLPPLPPTFAYALDWATASHRCYKPCTNTLSAINCKNATHTKWKTQLKLELQSLYPASSS